MNGITTEWNSFLDSFAPEQKDIYYREEYVRLYESETESAVSFVYAKDGKVFLLPFLRRSFEFHGRKLYDFETAYGYGGPIFNTNDEVFIHEAWSEFISYARSNDYVCGFVRFHPLLCNYDCFESFGKLYHDRKTIAIDLSSGLESAWKNEIHTKNRNVIKKGERAGLKFVVDGSFEHIEDFKHLYCSTMDKLEADDFYYFDDSYYESLKNNIGNSFLGLVENEGTFVAAAIFFYSQPYGHYHLAGSDKSSLALSPNNFLLWNAACELESRGVKYFHLGGGTDGNEENSLFQYKRKFSKNEYQFCFGKLKFNETLYDEICAEWEAANPEKAVKMNKVLLKYKY